MQLTVRPGDDITLHCDCRKTPGADIVWFRNCSHEKQPTLEIDKQSYPSNFKYNKSSDSYDLLVENVADSDLGLYYCGNKELLLEEEKVKPFYKYGSITTRISFSECTTVLCFDSVSVIYSEMLGLI